MTVVYVEDEALRYEVKDGTITVTSDVGEEFTMDLTGAPIIEDATKCAHKIVQARQE